MENSSLELEAVLAGSHSPGYLQIHNRADFDLSFRRYYYNLHN